MTKLYHVYFGSVCAGAEVDEQGIIINTAPILKKFKGQHIDKLKSWVEFIKGQIHD